LGRVNLEKKDYSKSKRKEANRTFLCGLLIDYSSYANRLAVTPFTRIFTGEGLQYKVQYMGCDNT
jgi:hypothetical protein